MKQDQNKRYIERRPTRRHPFQLWLLPLCLVVFCSGCKQQSKTAADANTVAPAVSDINPVGTYALVTVDGNRVPCTVQHEGHTLTVNSGRFIINADGTCSSHISLAGREAAIEVKAAYKREGPKLTMKWQGAGLTTGTVEGDTFTMDNEGMVFAYRK
jgi:hypothetical protein